MTSWEDVINQVTIPGDSDAILDLSHGWRKVLADTTVARDTLASGRQTVADWHGDAAEAYKNELNTVIDGLGKLISDYGSIGDVLQDASVEMGFVVANIPIPIELAPQVADARAGYQLSVSAPALDWVAKAFGLQKGVISAALLSSAQSRWNVYSAMSQYLPSQFNNFMNGVRDWITTQDDTAVKYYDRIDHHYDGVTRSLPATQSGLGDLTSKDTTPNFDGLGGGGPGPKLPELSSPTLDNKLKDLSDLDLNGDDSGDTDYGSGLSGVDGGGFSSYGPGGGGGGGGGLGTGASGLGAAPNPAAFKGLGALGSPFGAGGMPMMPMMGGMGNQSARGNRTGMMGGPGGAGATGNPGDERTNWLQEDEDVWGTDSGAAPPLLT